jgi:hypothetical protein
LQAIERRSTWQRRIPRPESGRGSRVRGQENDRPTQLRMSSRPWRRAIASIAACPAPWSITSNGATSALPPAAVISSGHRLRLTLPAVQHDGGAFSGECLRYGPAARGAGHQRDPGVQGNESVMLLPVLSGKGSFQIPSCHHQRGGRELRRWHRSPRRANGFRNASAATCTNWPCHLSTDPEMCKVLRDRERACPGVRRLPHSGRRKNSGSKRR